MYVRYAKKFAKIEEVKKLTVIDIKTLHEKCPLNLNTFICPVKEMIKDSKRFDKKPQCCDHKNWEYFSNKKSIKPYYKLKTYDDQTLFFESRFESGNLDLVYKQSIICYDLLL